MKHDFKNGFVANLPIGFSVAIYGSVCGMLSSQAGVALHEMVLMNVFIFAGSSQFVLVEMWGETLDVMGMIAAAVMINLRYFLIGASLNPLFKTSTFGEKMRYMHLVADENWAVTMGRLHKEPITPLFLFGGGVCLVLMWNASTVAGYLLGGFIAEPEKYALDFAFTAIFLALAFLMFRGKESLLPWTIHAFVFVWRWSVFGADVECQYGGGVFAWRVYCRA
ncbi:MAG: AzlC family ABC transporter permease [Campylobacterales bacterium]|nr:AzlC family ABC transporter permease [Campylobacterales bacterium]